jgi:hypothetical protein
LNIANDYPVQYETSTFQKVPNGIWYHFRNHNIWLVHYDIETIWCLVGWKGFICVISDNFV